MTTPLGGPAAHDEEPVVSKADREAAQIARIRATAASALAIIDKRQGRKTPQWILELAKNAD